MNTIVYVTRRKSCFPAEFHGSDSEICGIIYIYMEISHWFNERKSARLTRIVSARTRKLDNKHATEFHWILAFSMGFDKRGIRFTDVEIFGRIDCVIEFGGHFSLCTLIFSEAFGQRNRNKFVSFDYSSEDQLKCQELADKRSVWIEINRIRFGFASLYYLHEWKQEINGRFWNRFCLRALQIIEYYTSIWFWFVNGSGFEDKWVISEYKFWTRINEYDWYDPWWVFICSF